MDGGRESFDPHHLRIEAQERVMALQFGAVDKRLERIEALIERLERRLWMTVYGVVAVILTQAMQSLIGLSANGG
ncbi:hypothetical protein [Paracoccus sp. SCSIO 75233]|uniref:GTA head formation protein, RCAP_rcc01685 family n=1 Tax=Paracoccus sp. SCSIO 75233 TaxID=3017782 RepID=UPI0022EFFD5D|nr:hypothetical protein [Paracoccus sp. SCSIO 75233]WBU53836.1 hypothetical protein PAF12_03065 [Paracoccus sp. SCSIO 75233]